MKRLGKNPKTERQIRVKLQQTNKQSKTKQNPQNNNNNKKNIEMKQNQKPGIHNVWQI